MGHEDEKSGRRPWRFRSTSAGKPFSEPKEVAEIDIATQIREALEGITLQNVGAGRGNTIEQNLTVNVNIYIQEGENIKLEVK